MQIKDGVNAANLLSVASNINNNKNDQKPEELGFGDFASFLNSSSADKEIDKGTNPFDIVSKASDSKQTSDDKYKTRDAVSVKSEKKNDSNQKISEKKNDSKVNTKAVSSDRVDSGDEISDEEVVEVISSVVNMLIDTLGITMEELSDNMEQLGMELNDLMDEGALKELFLNIQNADVSQLLTDEGLQNDLSELLEGFEEVVEALPVSVDEAKDIISSKDMKLEDIPSKETEDFSDITSVISDNEDKNDGPVVEVKYETKSDTKDDNDGSGTKKSVNSEGKNQNHFENPILQGINDAVANVDDVSVVAPNTRPAEVIEQIIEQVRVNINQDNTSMEMQLYPEHLGRIQIHVISKDGVMTARIAAETETARQAIEAGLNNLKESLENQNLKVDAIEVMVSTAAFTNGEERQDDYRQQGNGNKNKKLNLSNVDEEMSDEEQEIEQLRASDGSSVTYLA